MTTLSEFTDTTDTTDLFLTNIEYTEVGGRPLIHLFGRDSDGNHHHQQVYGHNPHLSVPEDEYTDRIGNHYAVRNVSEGRETLDGRDTVRIDTKLPSHVNELREMFDEPLEADVLYESRFLIDTDITTGVSVPSDTDRCHYDDISPCEPPDVAPRVLTVDIEVAADDGFPDAEDAEWPVISIVGYNNYDDEYVGWLLCTDECQWDATDGINVDTLDDIRVYNDEVTLLDDFNQYVGDVQPDILTGWFSNDFDYPYLLNRCRNLSVWSYQMWSPLENAYTSTYGPVVDGVSCVDMLGVYEKTQIHNLKDKSLDAIAHKELDVGKIDIGDDYKETWLTDPETLLEYNHLDVELVTRIDEAVGGIELFTNLRNITGVSYEDPVGGNFEIMDITFLRRAKEYGYSLPTADKPEKDWYYGAKVFNPRAGISNDVVYMDVSSLYPSLIKQLNVSPETLRVEKPDEDYAISYIDTRSDNVKETSEPELTPVYYTTTKSGFVASLVDELIDMKNEYRGTGKYEAVKRITNSVYGVLSDADSYGEGFRLFDWRMGESICLSGRKIVTACSELCLKWCHENGYDNAYITMGDTDGFGICLPSSDGKNESLRVGYEMEMYVNENIPEKSSELFDIDTSQNEIELECESYAARVFIKGEDNGKSDVGVRKKYAQRIQWEK
jgi:DNA polymerase I